MKKFPILVAMISLLGIVSCYKTPTFPNVPHIDFDRYNISGNIFTLGDTGTLVLKFTDGDGDIGALGVDGASILSYINTKADTFFKQGYYNIPTIPQKGTSTAISGTIEIKLSEALFNSYQFYFLSHGKTIDTFAYRMKISDRAGNISNEITTPPIIVRMP